MIDFINSLLKTAKREKDLNILRSLYNGNKNNTIIKFEYAKMLIYKGFFDEGKELLLELLNTSNDSYARLELARLNYFYGNIDIAREYLNPIAKAGDKAAIYELARIESEQRNVEEAQKLLLSIISNKKDSYARVELGKIELSLGNVDKARKYYEEAIKNQKMPSAKLALGKLEKALGNIDKAKGIFEGLSASGDIPGKIELGRLEFNLGHVEEARKIFESINTNEYVMSGAIELGRLEAKLGNTQKAKEYFLSLINTRVERFGYNLLIVLCIQNKEYEEAFKYVKEALDKRYHINSDIIIDLSKRLNIFFNVDYQYYRYSYSMNQQLDYDPYCAIDHVIERHTNSTNTDFNENIDVYKLFNNMEQYLTEDNKSNKLSFNDIYLIPYKNAGANGENYIKVVTLSNTKNIITMYPVFGYFENAEDRDISKSDEELVRYLTK